MISDTVTVRPAILIAEHVRNLSVVIFFNCKCIKGQTSHNGGIYSTSPVYTMFIDRELKSCGYGAVILIERKLCMVVKLHRCDHACNALFDLGIFSGEIVGAFHDGAETVMLTFSCMFFK